MSPELFTLYFNLAFLIIVFSVVYFILTKPFAKRTDDKKEMDAVSRYLLCIGFVLLVFAFIAPHLVFTYLNNTVISSVSKKDVDELKSIYDISGPLGDTLGGIMNPFVAMAGVIVTGLAFYMQFKANKAVLEANDELRKQFVEQKQQYQLDKFESQFFEMLRLHKENVNEMEIEGYDYRDKVEQRAASEIYESALMEKGEKKGIKQAISNLYYSTTLNRFPDQDIEKKTIRGRKLFYLMLKEFEAIFLIVKRFHCLNRNTGYFVDSEKNIIVHDQEKHNVLSLSYHIFFSGKDIYLRQINRISEDDKLLKSFDKDTLSAILKEVEVLRTCHKKGVRYLRHHVNEKDVKQSLYLDFSYKPFGGHQIRLGHFYRHMIALVRHVVDQPDDLLSYEDKRKYLKIFRAQLSNYEVVLLYYNWLGGAGTTWEERLFEKDYEHHGNKFFTDYRILHNINKELVLTEFDPVKVFDDGFRDFIYKGDNPSKDKLFELYDIESKLTPQDNEFRVRR